MGVAALARRLGAGYLGQALYAHRHIQRLIYHSDRGVQYISIDYSERLAQARIEPSVGSIGNSYDNALAEAVIGLFKRGDDLLSRAVVQELGFAMIAMPMEFKGGAVKIHRLAKIDKKDSGEHLVLDLMIVTPETKKAWDERLVVEWEGGALKVVSPQGLILLKSLRGSGQD